MSHPSVGMVHPVFLPPFMFYQMKQFKALRQFKNEKASVNSAREVKRSAYLPFMVLLVGFMGTTAYQRYEDRREHDRQKYGMGGSARQGEMYQL